MSRRDIIVEVNHDEEPGAFDELVEVLLDVLPSVMTKKQEPQVFERPEGEARVVRSMADRRREMRRCTCEARMAGECMCGAWDDTTDEKAEMLRRMGAILLTKVEKTLIVALLEQHYLTNEGLKHGELVQDIKAKIEAVDD